MIRLGHCRAAFTLVELLVVMAIIGTLMALLLPAVNMVRESGRQTQCKNQLQQIGRAAQIHKDRHGHYPTGGWGNYWVGDPDLGFGPKQPGGWIYNVLPYVGYENVRKIGSGLTDAAAKKRALRELKAFVLPTFICPSRRRAMGYPARETSYNADEPETVAKTDYASNGGTAGGDSGYWVLTGTADRNCLQNFPNCSFPGGGYSGLQNYLAKRFDGLTCYLSEVRDAQIKDGLSRTIFAAEKYVHVDQYYSGTVGYDNNSLFQGHDLDITRWMRAAGPELLPLQDTKTRNSSYDQLCFGSAHSGGVNAVYCDGSATTIAFTIDPVVFEHLGNRADRGMYRGQIRTDSDTPQ